MPSALTLSLESQLSLGQQSVKTYIKTVRTIPMLTVEEEYALAEQLQQGGDLEAARLLVLSNLRFVVHISYGYMGYGLHLSDLIQEGNIGLMKAVKRFDPSMGVRLVSFAVHWIRAEIHEYILRNWRIVKIATTKAQRKLFFNLRSMKKHFGWLTQSEVENVAKDLGVSIKDVIEMEQRLSVQDVAFEAPPDANDDEETFAPETYIEDHRYDPAHLVEQDEWERNGNEQFYCAFAKLDDRSRDILTKRWLCEEGEKVTLSELAECYQVSAERIRQIEESAMKKLKKTIRLVKF